MKKLILLMILPLLGGCALTTPVRKVDMPKLAAALQKGQGMLIETSAESLAPTVTTTIAENGKLTVADVLAIQGSAPASGYLQAISRWLSKNKVLTVRTAIMDSEDLRAIELQRLKYRLQPGEREMTVVSNVFESVDLEGMRAENARFRSQIEQSIATHGHPPQAHTHDAFTPPAPIDGGPAPAPDMNPAEAHWRHAEQALYVPVGWGIVPGRTKYRDASPTVAYEQAGAFWRITAGPPAGVITLYSDNSDESCADLGLQDINSATESKFWKSPTQVCGSWSGPR